MQKNRTGKQNKGLLLVLTLTFVILFLGVVMAVDPVGPDSHVYGDNETKSVNSAKMVNISGGYISKMNLTATIQNPRWKAFVGEVIGSFTLDDSSGNTIYDWTLTTFTGRVYATRTNGAVSWSSINCSNNTYLEAENVAMAHTGVDDNITATFDGTTHSAFYVGTKSITANSCPTLNTYVSDSSQDTDFEEMALYDGTNHIYATILEDDQTGFDGENYDFQMLVPENGSISFTGKTAYYLYVEIGI